MFVRDGKNKEWRYTSGKNNDHYSFIARTILWNVGQRTAFSSFMYYYTSFVLVSFLIQNFLRAHFEGLNLFLCFFLGGPWYVMGVKRMQDLLLLEVHKKSTKWNRIGSFRLVYLYMLVRSNLLEGRIDEFGLGPYLHTTKNISVRTFHSRKT